MNKPKLYIICGHHRANKSFFNGHEREPGKVIHDKLGNEIDNEHWLMERLIMGAVKLLKEGGYSNFEVLPFHFDLKQKINYLNENANGTNPVLEFHANAGHSNISGAEVFYTKKKSIRSKPYAQELSKIVSKNMNIRNRGAKTEDRSQHDRLAIVSDTITYDFVVEIGFIPKDYKKMDKLYGVQTVYQCCKYILDKET